MNHSGKTTGASELQIDRVHDGHNYKMDGPQQRAPARLQNSRAPSVRLLFVAWVGYDQAQPAVQEEQPDSPRRVTEEMNKMRRERPRRGARIIAQDKSALADAVLGTMP